jgi:antirestriction protein ArdC
MLGMAAFAGGYETPYWATWKRWRLLGGQVRRGEHSTVGIFFKPLVKADGDGQEQVIPMIRAFRVFSADQVDG